MPCAIIHIKSVARWVRLALVRKTLFTVIIVLYREQHYSAYEESTKHKVDMWTGIEENLCISFHYFWGADNYATSVKRGRVEAAQQYQSHTRYSVCVPLISLVMYIKLHLVLVLNGSTNNWRFKYVQLLQSWLKLQYVIIQSCNQQVIV